LRARSACGVDLFIVVDDYMFDLIFTTAAAEKGGINDRVTRGVQFEDKPRCLWTGDLKRPFCCFKDPWFSAPRYIRISGSVNCDALGIAAIQVGRINQPAH